MADSEQPIATTSNMGWGQKVTRKPSAMGSYLEDNTGLVIDRESNVAYDAEGNQDYASGVKGFISQLGEKLSAAATAARDPQKTAFLSAVAEQFSPTHRIIAHGITSLDGQGAYIAVKSAVEKAQKQQPLEGAQLEECQAQVISIAEEVFKASSPIHLRPNGHAYGGGAVPGR